MGGAIWEPLDLDALYFIFPFPTFGTEVIFI